MSLEQEGAMMNATSPCRRGQYSRRDIIRIAAGPVATVLFTSSAACRGTGAPQPSTATAPRAPVKLHMFNQCGSASEIQDWTAMLELVQTRLPHVTFEIGGPAGQCLQFLEKALALGVAGTPPDFSYSVTRNGPTLMEAGLVEDMYAVARRERIDLTGVSKPVMDDFTWKGKLMALPLDIGYAFLRYNTQLFRQAGQPDPGQLWQEGRWNWDSFVAVAVALGQVQSGGQPVTGYLIRAWEGDFLSSIRSWGADVLNAERTQLALDSDAGIVALTRWSELVTRYRASPPPDRGPNPKDGFHAGQIGMVYGHPGNIMETRQFMRQAQTELPWDLVPPPASPGRRAVPTLFTNGLYLWKGTKHPAVTVEILKLLISAELMLHYGRLTGRDPARVTLITEHARNLNIPAEDPKNYVRFHQEVTNDVRGLPHTVNYLEWFNLLTNRVLLPVLRAEKAPKEALQAAAPAIHAILARP
jgi:ABC-type glycerol-3-phosphate transport system substrate-binding protein